MIKAGTDTPVRIPSKIDNLTVNPGDRIVYRTAGSGGWGDPLDRPAENVARDVRYDLVSKEKAEADYGVILTVQNQPDIAATAKLRAAQKEKRGAPELFNFGFEPPVREAAE